MILLFLLSLSVQEIMHKYIITRFICFYNSLSIFLFLFVNLFFIGMFARCLFIYTADCLVIYFIISQLFIFLYMREYFYVILLHLVLWSIIRKEVVMILIIQSLDKDAIKIQNKKYGEKKYMYISTELTSEKKICEMILRKPFHRQAELM